MHDQPNRDRPDSPDTEPRKDTERPDTRKRHKTKRPGVYYRAGGERGGLGRGGAKVVLAELR
jgi:hypothetical protein